MKKSNVILVYDENKEKILMCKRKKNPYKGLLNLVGGKVEKNPEIGIINVRIKILRSRNKNAIG